MSRDDSRLDTLDGAVERLRHAPAVVLGRNDERLRRAVLSAPAPVMIFDEIGRIHLLSQAWLELTGYTAEDLRSIDDWLACAPRAAAEALQAHLQQVVHTESTSPPAAFSFTTKDGRARHWSVVVSALGPLPDGRRLFICIASDDTDRYRAEEAARESERRSRELLEGLPAAIYTTDAAGRITFYNRAAAVLWGCEPVLGSAQWCGSWRLRWPDGRSMRHDECPMAVSLKENRPIRGAEAMAERPDGALVPFLAYPTPLCDAAGTLLGAVNMLIDIGERKQAERRLELLAYEVDHRAKNMLAVIQAMVRFTRADTPEAFASAIQGRIDALARVHAMLSASRWSGADLKPLIAEELAPYRREDELRVRIDGDDASLPPSTAQSIAIVMHELATNAAKYGALAAGKGRVSVHCARCVDGNLALRWAETGGPPVQSPSHRGFGTLVIERAVHDQLAGTVRFDWRAQGLVCEIRIPPDAYRQC